MVQPRVIRTDEAGQIRMPGFPTMGQIRKGAPKYTGADGKPRIGRDLEWFRFRFFEGYEPLAAVAAEAFGPEPREITIQLAFPTAAENWKEEFIEYDHSGDRLLHRCNGEICTQWYDKEEGRYRFTPKPCPGGCRLTGNLQVLVPAFRRFGAMTVITGSYNDVEEINRNLLALRALGDQLHYWGLRPAGGLNGIPCVLARRPRMVVCPIPDRETGQPKRVRLKKWLLSLEPEPAWVEGLFTQFSTLSLGGLAGLIGQETGPEGIPEVEGRIEPEDASLSGGIWWDDEPEAIGAPEPGEDPLNDQGPEGDQDQEDPDDKSPEGKPFSGTSTVMHYPFKDDNRVRMFRAWLGKRKLDEAVALGRLKVGTLADWPNSVGIAMMVCDDSTVAL